MNPKKYILFKKRSKIFRTNLVSNAGIITDPEKISVVRDWSIPRDKKISTKLFRILFLFSEKILWKDFLQ